MECNEHFMTVDRIWGLTTEVMKLHVVGRNAVWFFESQPTFSQDYVGSILRV